MLCGCLYDVDADSKDDNGRTPVSWTAENEHTSVIQLLKDRGNESSNKKSVASISSTHAPNTKTATGKATGTKSSTGTTGTGLEDSNHYQPEEQQEQEQD